MQTLTAPKKLLRPRTVVVSTSVPPSPTGQATVLGHLFEGSTSDNTLFISDDQGTTRKRAGELSTARYEHLSMPVFSNEKITGTFKSRWQTASEMLLEIRKRANEICHFARSFNPEILIACSGSRLDIPAVCYASLKLRIPFIVYMFDDPVMQWGPGRFRTMALLFERVWARLAKGLIAPNELLADGFFERERIRPRVVRNSISPLAFGSGSSVECGQRKPIRIVYTGSLYFAQADAICNFLRALEQSPGEFELHVYTAQSAEYVQTQGVASECLVFHDYVEGNEVYKIQQEADILLLPLAFQLDMRHVLKTASPQKMGEYLASGVPVLVHAPEDAFVSQFFKKQECGLVVNDASELAEAVKRLSSDSDLRSRVVERARIASEQFSRQYAQREFWGIVERAVGRSVLATSSQY